MSVGANFWAAPHVGTRFAPGSIIPSAELPSSSYHQVAPGISKSGLDKVRRNVHALLQREQEADGTSPHLDIGAATNDALLHPDTFRQRYMRGPEDRRGNRWKEALENAQMAGLTLLTERDYDLCMTMRDALLLHPEVEKLMAAGFEAEPSYFWEDPETGLLCRCRPDWDVPARDLVVDLKTAADASPSAFRKAVFSHRYSVQNALYCAGRAAVRGDTRGMVFVVVDKSDPRPENVGIYQLDDAFYANGWDEARRDLDAFAAWLRREEESPGQWRGFPLEVVRIAYRREQQEPASW